MSVPLRPGGSERLLRRAVRLLLRTLLPERAYLRVLFRFLQWRAGGRR